MQYPIQVSLCLLLNPKSLLIICVSHPLILSTAVRLHDQLSDSNSREKTLWMARLCFGRSCHKKIAFRNSLRFASWVQDVPTKFEASLRGELVLPPFVSSSSLPSWISSTDVPHHRQACWFVFQIPAPSSFAPKCFFECDITQQLSAPRMLHCSRLPPCVLSNPSPRSMKCVWPV